MSTNYFVNNAPSTDVLVPLLIALFYVILVLLYILVRCCERNMFRNGMLRNIFINFT